MTNIEKLIGKTFVCTDPDFEGCVGEIIHAWDETEGDWMVTYLNVLGKDFRGTFDFSEGYIPE